MIKKCIGCYVIIKVITMSVIRAEGRLCNDRNYQLGAYNYTIRNGGLFSISEAIELAKDEESLLVIEGPEQQMRHYEQIKTCNTSQVWLGIKQIAPNRQITDAGPWAWILDYNNNVVSCDEQEAGAISFNGCFKEVYDDRDLPVPSGLSSSEVTGDSCIRRCRELGQKYAGIQQIMLRNYSCYCGQSYGKYGIAEGCEPNRRCPEGYLDSCGGVGLNSIYHTNSNTLWGKWVKHYPAYERPYSLCGIIYQNFGSNGDEYFLQDESCDKKDSYICEFTTSASPCTEWAEFTREACNGSSCYCLSGRRFEKTWHKAKYRCNQYGGKLVSIETEAEHSFIAGWLLDEGGATALEVWVGISRETFKYIDSNKTVCYTNFNQNLDGSGTYAYMRTSDGSWRTIADNNDANASTITQSKIIENDKSTEPSTTDKLSDEGITELTGSNEEMTEQSTTEQLPENEIGEGELQDENSNDDRGPSPELVASLIILFFLLLILITGNFVYFCIIRGAVSRKYHTKSKVQKKKKRAGEAGIDSGQTISNVESQQLRASVGSEQQTAGVDGGTRKFKSQVTSKLSTPIMISEMLASKDEVSQEDTDTSSINADSRAPSANIFTVLATVEKMSEKLKSKADQLNLSSIENGKKEITTNDSNKIEPSLSKYSISSWHKMRTHGSSVDMTPTPERKTSVSTTAARKNSRI